MNRIKELRIAAGLSQKELAGKIGVTRSTISDWETKRSEPNVLQFTKVADLFNCSIDYLVGREDDFGIIQSSAPNSLTMLENELLTLFRKLDVHAQNKAVGYLFALAN